MHLIMEKRSSGFTLIELMVAMAIVGIISAVMFAAFQAQVRGQVSQDVSLSMTQSLRAAVDIMASDIRMTGCDPTDINAGIGAATGVGIQTAEDDNLVMTMDIGDGAGGRPDGVIGPGETIRYAINPDNDLGRAIDSTNTDADLISLHPDNIECTALNFVYLDVDGNPFAAPVTGTNLSDIKSIRVSVVIQSTVKGEDRQFQINETIDCRNL